MWIFYSIVAAIFWGLDYTLTGKVLEKIQFSTLLTIELFFGFLAMLGLMLASGAYTTDLPTLLYSSKKTILYIAVIIICFNIANVFIVLSIGKGNATLSGLIEISYPLFIAGFSWLLFGEVAVNFGTAIGGSLILFGVLTIYLFNK
jgi:drug/metabolite transporter (DMT)-like permease